MNNLREGNKVHCERTRVSNFIQVEIPPSCKKLLHQYKCNLKFKHTISIWFDNRENFKGNLLVTLKVPINKFKRDNFTKLTNI